MAKLKLTPKLQKKICDLIASGSFVNRAAEACGITETTFYDWLSQGEKSPEGVFADFYNAVKQAEAMSEAVSARRVFNAGETDWRASAWYLSHKFKKRWGDNQQVDIGNADNKPFQAVQTSFDLSKMSDRQIEAYEKYLETLTDDKDPESPDQTDYESE